MAGISSVTGTTSGYISPAGQQNSALLRPSSELEKLFTIAADPASTPVERGNALRAIDKALGRQAAPASGNAGTLASSAVGGPQASRLRAPTGPDLSAARRDGLINQLLTESRLNAGLTGDSAGAKYSKDLATSSNAIRHSSTLFPPGTYRSLTPPAVVGVGKPPQLADRNPLHVDRISQRNSEQTIRALNTTISNREADIKRLEQLDGALKLVPGGSGLVATNQAAIAGLRAQNARDRTSRDFHIDNARLQSSIGENGKAYQAIATNANPNATPVIFINGVNTDIYRSAAQALELSQRLGVPINHVVNVSSKGKLISGGTAVLSDTASRVSNKLEAANVGDQRVQQLLTGNSEAAATAANAIIDQLQNSTGKVRVIGYSQGAAIGTEALRKVNDILTHQGVSAQDRTKLLGRVEFLGIGPGAADRHLSQAYQNGPNGPAIRKVPELKAVTYKTISDANDPIAKLVNVSNADGSRTDGADLGKATSAIAQVASGSKGILPHLSYFKTYEATDPGSIYNPEFSQALKLWYRGQGAENAIIHGANTGR